MAGGAGNDAYIVDSASDVVSEAASAGTDTIRSSVNYTASANVENLTLTGTGAINATGNALNNVLTGNSAANALTGGDGDDTLVDSAGNDTLDGSTGSDVAVFTDVFANYQIMTNADGSVTVVHLNSGVDGADTLRGVERLQFSDGTIDAPQITGLVAAANASSEAIFAREADTGSVSAPGSEGNNATIAVCATSMTEAADASELPTQGLASSDPYSDWLTTFWSSECDGNLVVSRFRLLAMR
jgi:Ca2+-binding RTX toxin-like protein